MINILVCDDNKIIVDELNSLIESFGKKHNSEFNIDSRSSGDFILSEKAQI